MKKISNVTQGPRQLQFTPKGAGKPKILTLAEGGTTGATIEVSDEDWAAIQASPILKAILGDSNQFRVS